MGDGEQSTIDPASTEARIEQLVELEQELNRAGPTTSDRANDHPYAEGTIAGATKVPVEEVPGDYPVEFGTETALRVDVDVGSGTVETYMEWDTTGEGQGHVDRLLEVLHREPEEFANIFGDQVALDYRDGYHGIDPDETERMHRPSLRERVGFDVDFRYSGELVAGLVVATAVVTQLAFLGVDAVVGTMVALMIALPLAVAYDASRVDDRFDWEPLAPAWVVAAFLPVFNAPLIAAYLFRRRARRQHQEGETPTAYLLAVGLAGLASFATVPLLSLDGTDAAAMPWLFVTLLLPLAVYFDYEHATSETGVTSRRIAWTAGTAVFSLFFAGFLAAGAYLYYRLR